MLSIERRFNELASPLIEFNGKARAGYELPTCFEDKCFTIELKSKLCSREASTDRMLMSDLLTQQLLEGDPLQTLPIFKTLEIQPVFRMNFNNLLLY